MKMIRSLRFATFLVLGGFFLNTANAEQLVGVTDFSQRIKLTFNDPGVIEKVHIYQGQVVSRGDLLISLDTRILSSKVARTKAILSSLAPALQQKLTELDKANELYDRDSLARVDLENAEHDHKIAKARYDSAQADVDIAKLQLQSAGLLAPINGMIIGLNAHPGESIDNSSLYRTLIELADHTKMIAVTQVSSEIWHRRIENKNAQVTYRGKEYSGSVTYVAQERIEEANGIPGFEVRVLFSTNGDIPANMPVTIEIQE